MVIIIGHAEKGGAGYKPNEHSIQLCAASFSHWFQGECEEKHHVQDNLSIASSAIKVIYSNGRRPDALSTYYL
jgi:hypothetical protein